MAPSEIHDLRIQTERYHLEDGLTELVGGFYLLLMGTVILGPSVVGITVPILLRVLVLISPPLLFGPLMRWLKTRYTYPRIGFIAPRAFKHNMDMLIGIGLFVMVNAVIMAIFILLSPPNALLLVNVWLIAVVGISLMFGCGFMVYRYQLQRFWILAALCPVWAVVSLGAFALFALPDGASFLLFIILLSVSFISSGVATFWRYLREYTYPVKE
ncbi:MAG: hypothetical protein AAGF95_13350 [Chloroflexota bacterium]